MKILVINGSPKGKNGNTHRMVEAFLEGAKTAGAETENIFLKDKKINNCTGCFSCWTKTPGKCIFNDDVKDIFSKYWESDILVFASPVYSDNITADLKTLVDRMIILGTPYFEKDDNGEYRHGDEEVRKRDSPKFIMISNSGFPENTHFQVISHWINRYARNARGEVLAEIYRGQGPLLATRSEHLTPIIKNYKELLKKAGMEIVNNGKISNELQAELNKELIPNEMYIEKTTALWDRFIKK